NNKNETNNNLSLDFDIQRYVDVDISDSNLYQQEFSIRDAIPISLNLESFIFIKTHCIHNIFHIFKLPIKTEIKWKIKGGITNGAFKIGNGMDAEYFPRDSGDSVILYPQLQNDNDNDNNNNNDNKDFKNKKIFLELSVKQLDSYIFKKQEYQFLVTVDIFILRKFAKQTFRIKMFVNKMDKQNVINNSHSSRINNYNSNVHFNSDNTISTTTKLEKTQVRKKEGNDLLVKSMNNCKICNLSITAVNITKNNTLSPFSINFLKSYLITSDIIKVSAESNAKKITDDSIIITGSNYKKYSIDGIQIQPRLFWKSNIGNIVYGNIGQSLIYYTPGESDLSKSPITLNLYFQYDHSKNDIQQATLSDSKKFWMLRQPPLRLF
ncbi:MAG TPA: hypothetical protein VJ697_02595, partial [Nitrososphaeraceae archaeon]|nr:hypothetical protein [Nitrososphaeraceae archaeon]